MDRGQKLTCATNSVTFCTRSCIGPPEIATLFGCVTSTIPSTITGTRIIGESYNLLTKQACKSLSSNRLKITQNASLAMLNETLSVIFKHCVIILIPGKWVDFCFLEKSHHLWPKLKTKYKDRKMWKIRFGTASSWKGECGASGNGHHLLKSADATSAPAFF